MMTLRRTAALLLAALLTVSALPAPSEGTLAFEDMPWEIRPGKVVLLTFSAPADGSADIFIAGGGEEKALYSGFPAKAGPNSFTWDGTLSGQPLSPGEYTLRVAMGLDEALAPVAIGEENPVITHALPSDVYITPRTPWHMHLGANMAGTLVMRLEVPNAILFEGPILQGDSDIPWDGTVAGEALAPGAYTLVLHLFDNLGYSSNEYSFTLHIEEEDSGTAAAPAPSAISLRAYPAPADFSPYPAGDTLDFWTLPMDITDEAAIWAVMTQPITVLKGDQRLAYRLRAQPDDKAEAVGEITYDSQGVRVLETLDNGWSLIESHSSSFNESKVKVYGDMVQGYVKTSLLQTKKPSQEYGLLVDKLTQRMYVFKDGKLWTELLISTGILEDLSKPYTETQAGDYLLVSRTGQFKSDNLYCDMAMRFNNKNLMHQVPYTLRGDGSKYFDRTEPKLESKASHGCIRVQRRKNAQGVNMAWLWNNLKVGTRIMIWEDYKGRQIPIPAADTPLYYNPDGGSYYHSVANCPDVRDKFLPLPSFTYGQLEDSTFASLTQCPACAPPKRASAIAAINAAYAE